MKYNKIKSSFYLINLFFIVNTVQKLTTLSPLSGHSKIKKSLLAMFFVHHQASLLMRNPMQNYCSLVNSKSSVNQNNSP